MSNEDDPREEFVKCALMKLGSTVIWAHKGPDMFDCSGLVTWSLKRAGGPDLRGSFHAQRLFDGCAEIRAGDEKRGDLAFYGSGPKGIKHVAICLGDGSVLSASGASPAVKDIATAISIGARVKIHRKVEYRRDFVAIRRNSFIDKIPDKRPEVKPNA